MLSSSKCQTFWWVLWCCEKRPVALQTPKHPTHAPHQPRQLFKTSKQMYRSETVSAPGHSWRAAFTWDLPVDPQPNQGQRGHPGRALSSLSLLTRCSSGIVPQTEQRWPLNIRWAAHHRHWGPFPWAPQWLHPSWIPPSNVFPGFCIPASFGWPWPHQLELHNSRNQSHENGRCQVPSWPWHSQSSHVARSTLELKSEQDVLDVLDMLDVLDVRVRSWYKSANQLSIITKSFSIRFWNTTWRKCWYDGY